MARWARTMIRFRWAVLTVWLVAIVAGGIASSGLAGLLTNRFALPGSDSEQAATILKSRFGEKPEGSFSLVVKSTGGESAVGLRPPTSVSSQALWFDLSTSPPRAALRTPYPCRGCLLRGRERR